MLLLPLSAGATTLFYESFDDSSFSNRGWYDGAGGPVSTTEHIAGSAASLECHFTQGSTGCVGLDFPLRHQFTATETIYISFWVKHSNNWIGSGLSYHPHMMHIISDADNNGSAPYFGAYSNLAWNYKSLYIEEHFGKPSLIIQDGASINKGPSNSYINATPSLYTLGTETRSTGGCNGTQPNLSQTSVDCYAQGSDYRNGMVWDGPTDYYVNGANKTNWHFVEVYARMNTISGGVGQADGILQYSVDGHLEIDHQNVIIRTGQFPSMKFNQFIISNYIGITGGSPVDQYIWFDDLTVGDSRPSSNPALLNPPTNLRIQ